MATIHIKFKGLKIAHGSRVSGVMVEGDKALPEWKTVSDWVKQNLPTK